MTYLAVISSTAGLTAVMIAWGSYLASISRGRVAVRPIGTSALQLAGMALAVAGVVCSARDGADLVALAIGLASFALAMGGLFFFLLSQRKTPIGQLRVALGDPLIAFASNDSEGRAFHTDELAKKRILLKFFRGHW